MTRLRVPGDKSISHRVLILAALADGPSRLRGVLAAGDPRATAHVLRALGSEVPESGGNELILLKREVSRQVSDTMLAMMLNGAKPEKYKQRSEVTHNTVVKVADQAFWEAVIGSLLIIGTVVLIATNTREIREIYIFAAVLVLESLPFLSAVAIAILENSRMNSFAFWTRARIRTAEGRPSARVTAFRQWYIP